MRNLRALATLLTIMTGLAAVDSRGQLADPIPERIGYGGLTLELADWITLPASPGGGGGRARVSVFRELPDGRMFVNDLRGPLYRIDTGTAATYLNLRGQVNAFIDAPGLGAGFHSFAFHPEFAANGKFYTVHTEAWNAATPDYKGPTAPVNSSGMQSVLLEWTAANPAASTFTGTRRELLRIYFPGNIHTMQEVAFNPNAGVGDPDYGLLYVCIGEGGSYLRGYASNEHRLDSPMGTILRIDPLGGNAPNGKYGIPLDNPWYGSAEPGVIKEIYAYGFRNPHRIEFDTGGSGRIFVGDIGETQIEELNILLAGADYGFPEREGTFRLDPAINTAIYPLPADDAQYGYTYPVAQYDHDEGIAIVAGPVYRGSLVPRLEGLVFFGDIARGRIFSVVESELELGRQALITELRLRLDGVPGTLLNFVGSSRADLRWGMDNAGEIYVMTKTDGKIRRVVGAISQDDMISQDPARWQRVEDFTDGLGSWNPSTFAALTRVLPDPFGDAANRVVSIEGTSTLGYVPLPPTPSAGVGSIFFRVALPEAGSSARFTIAPIGASSPAFSSIVGEVSGAGQFTVTSGGSPLLLKDDLRPGIWYDIWILFLEGPGTFAVYLQGDTATTPILLGANIPVLRPVSGGLLRLSWTTLGPAPVLVDDIHVDQTMPNLSLPFGPRWALLSDFERADALAIWTFVDDWGNTTRELPLESAQVVEEASGNRFLSLTATAGDLSGPLWSHAHAPLPRKVEVSKNLTLYTRLRVDNAGRPTRQHFGFVNIPAGEVVPAGLDAIETLVRLNNFDQAGVVGDLEVAVGSMAVLHPALADPAGLSAGDWIECWILARNGGEASGGQTFDVYMRPDGTGAEPLPAYLDADFRVGRETPLGIFSIIAAAAGTDAAAVHYDDLYVIEGAVLESPSRTGYGLFPGPRGWKAIPWLGEVNDSAFPWIYHPAHAWLYCDSENPAGSWFYDAALGWTWMDPVSYPNLYSLGQQGWLYYLTSSAAPRWMYRYADGQWIAVP